MNCTRAYEAAGYSCKTKSTAWVEGWKTLNKPKVREYVRQKMDERSRKTEITAEQTLRDINNLANANITDIVTLVTDENGVVKMQIADFAILPDHIKKAIQSIKQNKDGTIEIKMHDKLKALELQGKHLGMFNDQMAVKNEETEKALIKLDEVLKEIKGVV